MAVINIKNSFIPNNQKIISVLESYLRGHISEASFVKMNVPEDGSCLFWAVTLAYLVPVKYDASAFQKRFKNLFEAEETINVQHHIQGLIQSYNPLLDSGFIFNDDTLKELVRKHKYLL